MDELNKPLSWLDNYLVYVTIALMLLVLALYSANRDYKQVNTAMSEALNERVYYVSKNSYDNLIRNNND